MEKSRLGRTDIQVSRICLGTMTWGEQNTREEAFEQMDIALDRGVNFFDTAELYAIPPRVETYGATERIIGEWFRARGRRDRVVLASKVACRNAIGRGPQVAYMREGEMRLDRANITAALDASLKRLQTDYIDLYQVHWPERPCNMFGQLGYDQGAGDDTTPILETLEILDELARAGKIRAIGVSNETPWGVMRYLHLAETRGLKRVVSVQNPYNLLNRTYDIGLAEVSLREDCGLLAYSPLAFGALSGKYLNGAKPAGARMTLWPFYARYTNPQAEAATARYARLAGDHGLDPAQMALAFVTARPFLTANIIGATTRAQLESNLDSVNVALSAEVLAEIEAIHAAIPNPAP
ncbi:MAG: NADP(H)-dependent aldo-keto reductase [Alphaproteobacteria bacterium]|nr:NADP(H)-dependent aldo-keto reductase [Alphaproteobacteria bacterium]